MILSEAPEIQAFQMGCMEFMKDKPDNYYDLAIVDPPYGIKQGGDTNHTRCKMAVSKKYHSFTDTSSPAPEYWNELIRVSANQIIWGANHFISKIPFDSSCWIVWDKDNGRTDFADCELAYTSFNSAVRRFKFRWQGMLQENMGARKEERIHPTQKPVALYRWLLKNYAKPNDKILDTHGGSMSSAIACHTEGFDLDICELDEDYFNDAVKRFKLNTIQERLF